MKNRKMLKAMAYGSAFAMMLGVTANMKMGNVEAASGTINYNLKDCTVERNGDMLLDSVGHDTIVLNLDTTKNISGNVISNANIVIKGNGSLSSAGIKVNGNLTVEKDANLSIEEKSDKDYGIIADGKIVSEGNIKVDSKGYGIFAYDYCMDDITGNDTTTDYEIQIKGGSVQIEGGYYGLESNDATTISNGTVNINVEDSAIYSHTSVDILGGNVTVSSNNDKCIFADKDVNVGGGSLKADGESQAVCSEKGSINISGGDLNINVSNCDTLYTYEGKINISGGNVITNAKHYSILAGNGLSVTGGYLESNCSFEGLANPTNNIISSEETIVLGDDMIISQPENSVIEHVESYYTNNYFITDAEGNIPTKVVFEKKAEPVIPDEEKEDKKEEKKDDSKKETKKDDSKKAEKKYSNEWVDGKWYNEDGSQTYKGTLQWKQNENGWWVEDETGWFAKNEWQKIDGKWYFFCENGYMDYSEYRDGCWLGSDGAWIEEYAGGHWMQDSNGWWYEDASGWYPQSQYVWIDGVQYWFAANGYMAE